MDTEYGKAHFRAAVDVSVLITDAPDVNRLELEPWRTWHRASNPDIVITRAEGSYSRYDAGRVGEGYQRVHGTTRRKDGSLGADVHITVATGDGPEWLRKIFEELRRLALVEFDARMVKP